MKLGDWLRENFDDMDWEIQDFREGVYFVWLRSEEEQKRMLDRGELSRANWVSLLWALGTRV